MSVGIDRIECMFEYSGMSTPARVDELRERIRSMQAVESPSARLPTRPDLAQLLPGGSLRAGVSYRVDGSTSLLFAALSEASQQGGWCALVGWPHLGIEAMDAAGLVSERTALVPMPGERWMSVVSALSEAMPLVAVRMPATARVSSAEAARLAARLRERGSTVLLAGPGSAAWPQLEASIQVQRFVWTGLGLGHGVLRGQIAEVTVRDRSGRLRSGRVRCAGVGAELSVGFASLSPDRSLAVMSA